MTHTHTASGKPTQTEVVTFTYDHGERLTKVTHKLNNAAAVTIAEYTYDKFGRVATKKVNGGNNTTYSYNIRGWLTSISNAKFTQSLTYNNGSTGYNGNITAMNWTANGQSHAYTFTYDGLNRMLNATHGSNQYTEKVTEYDKNGNIKKLQRYGQTGSSTYGLVDNLTYTYNGNKVTRVDDATTAPSYTGGTNFVNGASTSNEYVYDQNGNLTKDSNKGIANITYNLLSLPQVVTFSDGSTITCTYTHDGKKLRTVHVIGGVTTTTDYCGNVIYENGTAKKLLTDEGYVDLTTATPTYYYYLKDHQGNNRAVVNNSGTVQETNHYYPFGGLFSTSTNVQPYKYNGKELDTKKGLNLYDYGARHYDAALGRWHVVDPMAEKMGAWSPYGYCFNNPMKFVDKEGEVPFIVPFLVKGLIGAAIEATTQVSISMLSGNSFTEAVGNIDMVSVGKSFVTSAVPMGKVAKLGFEVADATVDVSANKGLKYIGEGKKIHEIVIDVAASTVSDKLVDGVTNSFNKAISEDLSANSAATMTKGTKEGLKHMQETINSEGVQTTASAVTGFATGAIGELVNQQIDTSILDEEFKNK